MLPQLGNQRLSQAPMFQWAPRRGGWGYRSLTPTHQHVSGPQPPLWEHCGLQQCVEVKAFDQQPWVIGAHEVMQQDLGWAAGGRDLQRTEHPRVRPGVLVWAQEDREGPPHAQPTLYPTSAPELAEHLRQAGDNIKMGGRASYMFPSPASSLTFYIFVDKLKQGECISSRFPEGNTERYALWS